MNWGALRCMVVLLSREAWAGRVPLYFIGGLLGIAGLIAFAGQLTSAERNEFQCVLLAPLLRIYALLFVLLFVSAQLCREWQARQHEAWLTLPLSAAEYWFGKFIGYACLSGLAMCPTLLLLLCFAAPDASLVWLFSLYLETWIIIACTMFCTIARRDMLLAFGVTIGFWILACHARLFLDISAGTLLADSFVQKIGLGSLLLGIEWVLPDLHLFTRTEWLAYPERVELELLPICMETLLCLAWLAAAGLWELGKDHHA
ncbi:MAG: hypothetical protein ACYYK0_00990 [Candidatus Eutrophobiaceae bacterium]